MKVQAHKTLFLDTNYFLHYPPVTQVDWRRLAGAKSVKLCVCITVVHELDDKKTDPSLGERAARVIKELTAIRKAGGAVSDGVTLELLSNEHRREDFPSGFSPDSADDAILLHVVKYQDKHSDECVSLVSEDLGMEMKGPVHGIDVLKPDAVAVRLPNPEDARTRKHQQVVKELAQLKNTLPDLAVLGIVPGMDKRMAKVQVTLAAAPKSRDIEADIRDKRDAYPHMHGISMAEIRGLIGKEEYERYNNEVDAYLEDYRAYLEELRVYEAAESRTFRAKLVLENKGGSPADNVDVHMHFPDGFSLRSLDESEDLQPPNEPST